MSSSHTLARLLHCEGEQTVLTTGLGSARFSPTTSSEEDSVDGIRYPSMGDTSLMAFLLDDHGYERRQTDHQSTYLRESVHVSNTTLIMTRMSPTQMRLPNVYS